MSFLDRIDDPPSPGQLAHMNTILCRPWFTRVWVIQEVVSAVYPITTCGAQTIHWDHFVSSLRTTGEFDVRNEILGKDQSHCGYNNVMAINEMRNCRLNENSPMALQDVLLSVEGSKLQIREIRSSHLWEYLIMMKHTLIVYILQLESQRF